MAFGEVIMKIEVQVTAAMVLPQSDRTLRILACGSQQPRMTNVRQRAILFQIVLDLMFKLTHIVTLGSHHLQ